MNNMYLPYYKLSKTHNMIILSIKEELDLKPKLSMFCVLSQNYQHSFEK